MPILNFNLSYPVSNVTQVISLYNPSPAFQYDIDAYGNYTVRTDADLLRDLSTASAGVPSSISTLGTSTSVTPLPVSSYAVQPASAVYGLFGGTTSVNNTVLQINSALAPLEPGFSRVRVDYMDVTQTARTDYFDCPFYEGWDVTANELNNIVQYIKGAIGLLQSEMTEIQSELSGIITHDLWRGISVSGQLQWTPATTGLLSGPLAAGEFSHGFNPKMAKRVRSVDRQGLEAGKTLPTLPYQAGIRAIDPNDMLAAVSLPGTRGFAKTPTGVVNYCYFDDSSDYKGSAILSQNTDGTITFMLFDENTFESGPTFGPDLSLLFQTSPGQGDIDLCFPQSGGPYGISNLNNAESDTIALLMTQTNAANPNQPNYTFGFESGYAPIMKVPPINDSVPVPWAFGASRYGISTVLVVRMIFNPAGAGCPAGTQWSLGEINGVNYSSSGAHAIGGDTTWNNNILTYQGPQAPPPPPPVFLPSITGISPADGQMNTAQSTAPTITIFGTNFSSEYGVYIVGAAGGPAFQPGTNWTSTSVEVYLPGWATPGLWFFYLADASYTSNEVAFTVDDPPGTLGITGIVAACPGQNITITGLFEAAFVNIIDDGGNGYSTGQLTNVSVTQSPTAFEGLGFPFTQIIATLPTTLPLFPVGAYLLQVGDGNGPNSAAYTIPAVCYPPPPPPPPPPTPPILGTFSSTGCPGAAFTLSGSNLGGTTNIWFNDFSHPASSFTVQSSTTIVGTLPVSPITGAQNLILSNPFFQGITMPVILVGPPQIVNAVDQNTSEVNAGGPQDTIVITGSGFNTPGSVVFTDVHNVQTPVAVTSFTSTSILCTVPSTLVLGNYQLWVYAVCGSTSIPWVCSHLFHSGAQPLEVILPAALSLSASQVQNFEAYILKTGFAPLNYTLSATWLVDGIVGGNSSVGTITAQGLYVAPSIINAATNITVTALVDYIPVPDDGFGGNYTATVTVNLIAAGALQPFAQLTVVSQLNIFLGDGRAGYVPTGSTLVAYPGQYVYVQFNEFQDQTSKVPVASNTDIQTLTMLNITALSPNVANTIYNLVPVGYDYNSNQIITKRTVVLGMIDPTDGNWHSMWDIGAPPLSGNSLGLEHGLPLSWTKTVELPTGDTLRAFDPSHPFGGSIIDYIDNLTGSHQNQLTDLHKRNNLLVAGNCYFDEVTQEFSILDKLVVLSADDEGHYRITASVLPFVVPVPKTHVLCIDNNRLSVVPFGTVIDPAAIVVGVSMDRFYTKWPILPQYMIELADG